MGISSCKRVRIGVTFSHHQNYFILSVQNNIIFNQNERIADLEVDLKKLKDEYSKIVYTSYKKRSSEMKMMFLFASDNINQAFKRFQYFKQYSKYRKEQANKIVLIQILKINY